MKGSLKAGTGEQPNKEDEEESSENLELDSEGKHPDLEVFKKQFEFGNYVITIQARALSISDKRVEKTFQRFKSVLQTRQPDRILKKESPFKESESSDDFLSSDKDMSENPYKNYQNSDVMKSMQSRDNAINGIDRNAQQSLITAKNNDDSNEMFKLPAIDVGPFNANS